MRVPSQQRQLERDLERARLNGRWLSDEEHQHLDQRQQQRGKLIALLVLSLIIPPLWPVAVALSLYLLFPLTSQRLAVGLGVSLLLLGVLGVVAITALLVALLSLLL